jgi:GNAT superfamily N-acetyltransferase
VEAAVIAAMIEPVFASFMAPDYDDEGRRAFRAFIAPAAIADRLNAGGSAWVAQAGSLLVGYIERTGRHIHLLFVDAAWQGQGLSRRLLDAATAGFDGGSMTLNASPYALPIYQRLGFRVTGEQRTITGVVSTPMVLEL